MMADWTETTIAELASPDQHALATGPFGSAISSRYFVEEGVPVLRGSNLSLDVGVRIDDEGLVFLTPEKADTFQRSKVRSGDLVFTCWGTIGQVGLVDSRTRFDEYVLSNKQMKLTPDPNKADSLFLYYLLSGPAIVEEVRGQSIGAAVPGFNLGQLRQIRVRVPHLELQQRIAQILGSFDDLIENSRRRIELLKQMTQAIYREWFVHFRYPGHEGTTQVDSSLGLIPEGWEVSTIGQVLELRYGKALKASNRKGGSVAVVGSSDVVGWHDEEIVSGPAIVVGRKGNVGNVTWVPGPCWPIDTTYYVRTDLPLRYVAEQLKRAEFINTHAAVPGLSRDQAYSLPFLLAPSDIMLAFSEISDSLGLEGQALSEQIKRLALMRDLLLPRLVTGQIQLSSLGLDAVVESVA